MSNDGKQPLPAGEDRQSIASEVEKHLVPLIQSNAATVKALEQSLETVKISNEQMANRWDKEWEQPKQLFSAIVVIAGVLFTFNFAQQFFSASEISERSNELRLGTKELRNQTKDLLNQSSNFDKKLKYLETIHNSRLNQLERKSREYADQSIEGVVLKGEALAQFYATTSRVNMLLNLGRDQLTFKKNPEQATSIALTANGILDDADNVLEAFSRGDNTRGEILSTISGIRASTRILLAECHLQLGEWEKLGKTAREIVETCCEQKEAERCYEREGSYYLGLASLHRLATNSAEASRTRSQNQHAPERAEAGDANGKTHSVLKDRKPTEAGPSAMQAPAGGGYAESGIRCAYDGYSDSEIVLIALRNAANDDGPRGPANVFLTVALFELGEYQEALERSELFLAEFPQHGSGRARLDTKARSYIRIVEAYQQLTNLVLEKTDSLPSFPCSFEQGAIPESENRLLERLTRNAIENRAKHLDACVENKNEETSKKLLDTFGLYGVEVVYALKRACEYANDDSGSGSAGCEPNGGCGGDEAVPEKPGPDTELAALLAEYQLPARIGGPEYSRDMSLGIVHDNQRIMRFQDQRYVPEERTKTVGPPGDPEHVTYTVEVPLFFDNYRTFGLGTTELPPLPYTQINAEELEEVLRLSGNKDAGAAPMPETPAADPNA